MSISPPGGATPAIELRPVRADELGAVCALINRAAVHEGIDQVETIDELEQALDHDDLDPLRDTRVALVDGQLAGLQYVLHPRAEIRIDRAWLLGEVDPDQRGKGVGTALLEWGVHRARERFAARAHDLPKRIWVTAYESSETNRRLYVRFGFTPVRWYDELIRALTDLPAVAVPAGVELRTWTEGRDEDLRVARNAAFADHWGSEPVDAARWHDAVHGAGGRPDLSVFAVDRESGDVVGICVNRAYPADEALTGRREAWIHNVATVSAWREKGIASAMVAWSLQAFEAAGFTHAVLSVDSASPTGAARLYRALGFESLRRSVLYEIGVS